MTTQSTHAQIPSQDDPETTQCPVCQRGFTPIGRQAYCSTACRKTAFRRRHQQPARPHRPGRPAPPAAHHLRMPRLRRTTPGRTTLPGLSHLHPPRQHQAELPPLRRTRHHHRPHRPGAHHHHPPTKPDDMNTAGSSRGHQRAHFMAASGQKPVSLDRRGSGDGATLADADALRPSGMSARWIGRRVRRTSSCDGHPARAPDVAPHRRVADFRS